MEKSYDVVVIGAGSGGLTAAVGFYKVGKKVLLIEREHMGGECTNSGCIPSKALLHRAKQYYSATQVAGESAESSAFRNETFNYVREVIDDILKEETPEAFKKLGIDVVMGEAIFNTKCSVKVGEDIYQYKTAIIATGSSPRLLHIPGLAESEILTNQNLFKLTNIPERTLVIGSGPIGLEMGQALAILGSQVTIATIDTDFARLEDPAIRPILRKKFEELGITIHTNAFIKNVEGSVAIFEHKHGDQVEETFKVPFDKVLVAVGRIPNVPKGLEQAEIQFDSHCVLVDSQQRTSNKYVYAIGDVAQRLKFTHTADDAARQVVTRVVSRGWLRVNTGKAVPKVTYTEPEIAQVGLSWNDAKIKYPENQLMRIEVPFFENDRAKTDEETQGLLVVIARRLNGAVLGAHVIGPRAGELIIPFTLAIDNKISMWQLRRTIYAYPTYSLIIKKAGDYFFAEQLSSLKADLLNLLKRHLPKIIAGLFWLTLIYQFQHYKATSGLSYQDMLFNLYDFFTMSMYGPLIYIVLYAIRPLIFFPATLLTALSGALFGFWWGVLYTIVGENASANFAYWIGRFFGKDLKLEDSVIGNWIEALRKNSFGTVLLMRLFYVPFDLTNYGSGIVKAKWSSYFFATLIGIIPGLTTFVALGSAVDLEEFRTMGLSFDAFNPKFLALSVTIFVVSLFLSKILKRWRVEG